MVICRMGSRHLEVIVGACTALCFSVHACVRLLVLVYLHEPVCAGQSVPAWAGVWGSVCCCGGRGVWVSLFLLVLCA